MNKTFIGAIISVSTLTACAPDFHFSDGSVELSSESIDTGLAGGVSVPQYQAVTQSFEVKENPDIDVLFVVDNSGSMDVEQKNISSKINGFMSLIKDMNWQIALTTTDSRVNTIAADKTSRAWGDGQFRPFDADNGSLFVLKASDQTVDDAQTKLSKALNVGLLGDGEERAIYASYRAIERTATTAANQDFFRENSKLVVVAISDEDECSNGKCSRDADKSVPQNLVNLVHDRFGTDKVFMYDSIVRATTDSACKTAALAPIYEAMAKLTGGVIGSVCSSDYTSILSSIGTKTAELVKSINLNCQPVDADSDGSVDFALYDSKGNLISSGYSISGTTVSFSSYLSEGSYSAQYSCAVSVTAQN